MTKGVLRFFFDYGAGGCLWAGDTKTHARLGVGPVDAGSSGADEQASSPSRLHLSEAVHRLRDQLDFQHSGYLNPLHPLDPSLWSQALCDRFNADVDRLLTLLHQELGADYTILDEQPRYTEDVKLGDYLATNPGLVLMDEVKEPTVR
ncbi:hypothetical protein [Paracoccus yeei]|uniref:Uncharacterized protein n=1 Tax=Paracoccus yeei TaxID=147645 RepID=A0A5P2QTU0_9RHOB|nr:hypothetical protein [Paracoccus yeei]MBY0135584.1 hypothetical protein [Paracoccus yeei]QEU08809.1 hypothetical protein FOB51_12845 [Paracoccus yeei]